MRSAPVPQRPLHPQETRPPLPLHEHKLSGTAGIARIRSPLGARISVVQVVRLKWQARVPKVPEIATIPGGRLGRVSELALRQVLACSKRFNLETAVDRLQFLGAPHESWLPWLQVGSPFGRERYAPDCTTGGPSGGVARRSRGRSCVLLAPCQPARQPHTRPRPTTVSRFNERYQPGSSFRSWPVLFRTPSIQPRQSCCNAVQSPYCRRRLLCSEETVCTRRSALVSSTQGATAFSSSGKLLIFTDPSGKRAATSSSPPIASIGLRKVEICMSVRRSSLVIAGCWMCGTSASTF